VTAEADMGRNCSALLVGYPLSSICEPYGGFIRSWIFKVEIHDPYKEFIVENIECISPKSHVKTGHSIENIECLTPNSCLGQLLLTHPCKPNGNIFQMCLRLSLDDY